MVLVVDSFPFYNEVDLLLLRINTLSSLVDYFVITEATTTFAGNPKSLNFEKHKDLFSNFRHKIHYQVVDQVPNLSPFERDWYQRDQAKSLLSSFMKKDDILIYGDVDEIPNPMALVEAFGLLSQSYPILHLAQDLFYYYLNMQEISGTLLSHAGDYPGIPRKSRKWLGTVVTNFEFIGNSSMTSLREPSHKLVGKRIMNGGWHFSYMGGYQQESVHKRVLNKIENSAHQELNTSEVIQSVEKMIELKKDIFKRRKAKFRVLDDYATLPLFVRENIPKFQHLLKS